MRGIDLQNQSHLLALQDLVSRELTLRPDDDFVIRVANLVGIRLSARHTTEEEANRLPWYMCP